MKKILLSILLVASFSANAATETFDTAADMNALLDLDVFTGDNYTTYGISGSQDVFFNQYTTTNSISLKDNAMAITGFDFKEYIIESSTGNNWTWSFYDAADTLVGTNAYINDGDSDVQFLNLITLGFLNVNTVQLSHLNGFMHIDNLQYSSLAPSAVPIPAAAFLFAPALLGFMGLRRKAKNSVA